MVEVLVFPDERSRIREQAAAFHRLSPQDRFNAILDLIASGVAILEQSPHRAAARQLREAEERRWREIQQELFARYGC